MRGFDIVVFGAGLLLVLSGISDRSPLLAIAGVVVLVGLWAFRGRRKRNSALNVMLIGYPGCVADIRYGDSGYTGYLTGVPNDRAAKAVDHVWTTMYLFFPRKRDRIAVVVRDRSGKYWGTDWVRMNPPHAALVLYSDADPSNPLFRTLIETGAVRLGADRRYYQLVAKPPWGPLDTPAPVDFALPSVVSAEPITGPPSPEVSAPTPAGWYADPMNTHQQRWWTGRSWSATVSDDGAQTLDDM